MQKVRILFLACWQMIAFHGYFLARINMISTFSEMGKLIYQKKESYKRLILFHYLLSLNW